jgi:hypothetical protein
MTNKTHFSATRATRMISLLWFFLYFISMVHNQRSGWKDGRRNKVLVELARTMMDVYVLREISCNSFLFFIWSTKTLVKNRETREETYTYHPSSLPRMGIEGKQVEPSRIAGGWGKVIRMVWSSSRLRLHQGSIHIDIYISPSRP